MDQEKIVEAFCKNPNPFIFSLIDDTVKENLYRDVMKNYDSSNTMHVNLLKFRNDPNSLKNYKKLIESSEIYKGIHKGVEYMKTSTLYPVNMTISNKTGPIQNIYYDSKSQRFVVKDIQGKKENSLTEEEFAEQLDTYIYAVGFDVVLIELHRGNEIFAILYDLFGNNKQSELKKELERLTNQTYKLNSDKIAIRKELEAKVKELNDASEKLASVNKQLEDCMTKSQSERRILEEKFEEEKRRLSSKIDNLERDIREIKTRNDTLEKDNKELHNKLVSLEQEVLKANESVKLSRMEIDGLLVENSMYNEERIKDRSMIENLNRELGISRDENDSLRSSNTGLQSELSTFESSHNELLGKYATLYSETKSRDDKIAENQVMIENLNRELGMSRDENNSLRSSNTGLQSELNTFNSKYNKLLGKYATLNLETKSRDKKIAENQAMIENLNRELGMSRDQNELLKLSNTGLESELKEVRNSLYNIDTEVKSNRKIIEKMSRFCQQQGDMCRKMMYNAEGFSDGCMYASDLCFDDKEINTRDKVQPLLRFVKENNRVPKPEEEYGNSKVGMYWQHILGSGDPEIYRDIFIKSKILRDNYDSHAMKLIEQEKKKEREKIDLDSIYGKPILPPRFPQKSLEDILVLSTGENKIFVPDYKKFEKTPHALLDFIEKNNRFPENDEKYIYKGESYDLGKYCENARDTLTVKHSNILMSNISYRRLKHLSDLRLVLPCLKDQFKDGKLPEKDIAKDCYIKELGGKVPLDVRSIFDDISRLSETDRDYRVLLKQIIVYIADSYKAKKFSKVDLDRYVDLAKRAGYTVEEIGELFGLSVPEEVSYEPGTMTQADIQERIKSGIMKRLI